MNSISNAPEASAFQDHLSTPVNPPTSDRNTNPLDQGYRRISNVVYDYIHAFLGRKLLSAQDKSLFAAYIEPRKAALKEAGDKVVHFPTEDELLLEGMHFIGKNCKVNSRTLILFNGVMLRYEMCCTDKGGGTLHNVDRWLEAGCNILLFNYRGIGNNGSYATKEDLILDGETPLLSNLVINLRANKNKGVILTQYYPLVFVSS